MAKFKKIPVIIEAHQWFINGDHPLDYSVPINKYDNNLTEGKLIRYYRTPKLDGKNKCKNCGKTMHYHGWIETLEGGHIVCPGDWIITGVNGEHYPCKPDIFKKTYELVE